jgi:hypothetical protein
LNQDANKKHKDDDNQNGGTGLSWKKNITDEYGIAGLPRINPFDHSENFGDWS